MPPPNASLPFIRIEAPLPTYKYGVVLEELNTPPHRQCHFLTNKQAAVVLTEIPMSMLFPSLRQKYRRFPGLWKILVHCPIVLCESI